MFLLSFIAFIGCLSPKQTPPPISITLPKATALETKELTLRLRLDENEQIFLDDKLLSETELRENLQDHYQSAQNNQQKLTCIIEVAPSIPYEKVINVIDLLKQEGIDNFVLSVPPEKD